MKKHGLNELREMFLSFFETKDHLRLPSFSLIPQNDASLLLINSGMAPMKPYSEVVSSLLATESFLSVMYLFRVMPYCSRNFFAI